MPKEVNRYQVRELLAEGGQLIEVLPHKEYTEAHLPGAISIPLDDFHPENLEHLDRARPVIVYCANNQ